LRTGLSLMSSTLEHTRLRERLYDRGLPLR
jgi:hypothetical protein